MAEKRDKKRGHKQIGLLVVAFFVLFVEKGVMVSNWSEKCARISVKQLSCLVQFSLSDNCVSAVMPRSPDSPNMTSLALSSLLSSPLLLDLVCGPNLIYADSPVYEH